MPTTSQTTERALVSTRSRGKLERSRLGLEIKGLVYIPVIWYPRWGRVRESKQVHGETHRPVSGPYPWSCSFSWCHRITDQRRHIGRVCRKGFLFLFHLIRNAIVVITTSTVAIHYNHLPRLEIELQPAPIYRRIIYARKPST